MEPTTTSRMPFYISVAIGAAVIVVVMLIGWQAFLGVPIGFTLGLISERQAQTEGRR